jgi:hypothetical protein
MPYHDYSRCLVRREALANAGAFVIHGSDMPTIDEVDEALRYTSLVPLDARGEGWHAWVDALLEQRKQLEEPQCLSR